MSTITRLHTGTRMSQIVTHGDTIYLAGQVGTRGASVAQQTQDCLDKIDALLAEVGSDKTRLLQTTIWLADMAGQLASWAADQSASVPARAR